MSTTLLKTDSSEAFTLQVATTVNVSETGDNNTIQLGQVLYHVLLKDLLQADVMLHANKVYRIQGTVTVQEVTEDEAAAFEG